MKPLLRASAWMALISPITTVERTRQELVHLRRVVSLDEMRRVAVAAHQRVQLLVADAGQHRGVGDLVAVQVQNGQHAAVAGRVEELVAVPAGGQRSRLGLAVADDAGDDQVGVIEDRAVGVRQCIAQLAAFVDGAGRLRGDVAGNAAGERELGEEPLQARFVLADVRIDLAVRPFQVGVGHQRRPTVPGAGDVEHVQVVLFDDPIQVNVEEVLARRGSPMAEQAGLDVLKLQWLLQERIVHQVNLADRQVVGGSPVGIHSVQIFFG